MNIDTVVKYVTGLVRLRGGTDGTVIGNTTDKLRVDGSGVVQPVSQSGLWTNSFSSVASSVGLSGVGDLFLSTGMFTYSGLSFSLTGTFDATVEVFGSNNGGATYFSIPVYSVENPDDEPLSQITEAGLYFIKITSDVIKVSVTAYTSGTINGNFYRFTSTMDPSVNAVSVRSALYDSYSPDPSNTRVGSSNFSLDASGRLETHGAVTTDEGSFRDDFSTALAVTLTNNVTWVAGSDQIVGSGFFAELKSGDYVKKSADANTLYVRVASVDSDTNATLESTYAGTSGSASSVKSNFVQTVGAGSTVSVASSVLSIVMPTTTGVISSVIRTGDYGPLVGAFALSMTARVTNQTVSCGFQAASGATPGARARFEFTGTDNTLISCVSSSSSGAGDTQTTTVKIPNSQTSATQLRYEVNVTNNQVSFVIAGVTVAVHQDHIPGPYDNLTQGLQVQNTGTAGGANTANLDWIQFNNVDQLEITNGFTGEPVRVVPLSQTPPGYSASIDGLNVAGGPTDIFTITGSATKVVKIRRVTLSGWRTANTQFSVVGLKRSTANTAGTSTTPTVVPFDSAFGAGTAVARAYTANPTLGTLVGNLFVRAVSIGTQTPGNAQSVVTNPLEIEFTDDRAPVLRGTNEVFALNLAAVSIAGSSLRITVEWTEGDR